MLDNATSGAGDVAGVACYAEKNPYHLLFGPSDEDGLIRITGEELVAAARADANSFLMDYVSFPERWTGGIGAEIIDAAGVERMRSGLGVWGRDNFPEGYEEFLDAYEEWLTRLERSTLSADVAYAQ